MNSSSFFFERTGQGTELDPSCSDEDWLEGSKRRGRGNRADLNDNSDVGEIPLPTPTQEGKGRD
jgi:hypothetical protein